jgi:hypothetical protein
MLSVLAWMPSQAGPDQLPRRRGGAAIQWLEEPSRTLRTGLPEDSARTGLVRVRSRSQSVYRVVDRYPRRMLL